MPTRIATMIGEELDVEKYLTLCSMDYAPEGVCCTKEEEDTALEETFNAVGDRTAECADYYYYKQALCQWQNVIS